MKSSNAPLVEFRREISQVPECGYHPSAFSIFADHTLPQQIPGIWFDECNSAKHQLLTVYSSIGMTSGRREKWWLNDKTDPDGSFRMESRHAWAAMAGCAELTAQAYHLGYSMWRDIDRPLVGRFALTDGCEWTFSTFQLNSLELFRSNAIPNVCSMDEKIHKLWTIADGQVMIDRTCLGMILFAIQQPTEELSIPLGLYKPVFELENDRHRSLCRQLYEICRHSAEQSMFDDRSLKMGKRSNFARHYGQVMFRYADVVRQKYPQDVWGYELTKIARNPRRPLPSQYDKQMPDSKPSTFFFY